MKMGFLAALGLVPGLMGRGVSGIVITCKSRKGIPSSSSFWMYIHRYGG
jgi:hypothetical protein